MDKQSFRLLRVYFIPLAIVLKIASLAVIAIPYLLTAAVSTDTTLRAIVSANLVTAIGTEVVTICFPGSERAVLWLVAMHGPGTVAGTWLLTTAKHLGPTLWTVIPLFLTVVYLGSIMCTKDNPESGPTNREPLLNV